MNVDLIAAATQLNRVDLFGIGPDGAVYHNAWSGNALILPAWESVGIPAKGNPFVTAPAAVSWGLNRFDVVAVAADNKLYHNAWSSSGWLSSWESLGSPAGVSGGFNSAPVIVSRAFNSLDVFCIGMDNQLYHIAWTGTAWQAGWEPLGSLDGAGAMWNFPPAVACWSPGRIDVFAQGANHSMYHKSYDDQNGWLPGPGTTSWESPVPGQFYSPPAAASWGNQRVDVFALGQNLSMYHVGFTGSAWLPSQAAWENLGGGFFSKPAVVSRNPNSLDVFAVGFNGQIYQNAWTNGAWEFPAWTQSLGGGFLSPPIVVSTGPNSLDIFALGLDMKMYHRSAVGNTWSPLLTQSWNSLGGPLGGPFARPASPPAPPNRLDFDTGWIAFSGSAAVGGPTHVTLHSNGNAEFSGQFHDSGASSYNYGVVVAIMDSKGNTYPFQHVGSVSAQNRNDAWDTPSSNPAVAKNWSALVEGSFIGYQATEQTNDIGAVLSEVLTVLVQVFTFPIGEIQFNGGPGIPESGNLDPDDPDGGGDGGDG